MKHGFAIVWACITASLLIWAVSAPARPELIMRLLLAAIACSGAILTLIIPASRYEAADRASVTDQTLSLKPLPIEAWFADSQSTLARLARHVFGNNVAEIPLLAAMSVLLIGGTWIFLDILKDVVVGDPVLGLDKTVFEALQAVRDPVLDRLLIGVTEIGDAAPVALTVPG